MSGTFSATTKNFRIDHPLDPANKYLVHSSVESSERMYVYRGVVRTDSSGYATVIVPTWFDALNENIQYQLTVTDESDCNEFVQAKVVKKLVSRSFKIRTSAPGVEVDWQLTASRHDPDALATPLVVEEEKTGVDRGKYLTPTVHGASRDLQLGAGVAKKPQGQNDRP